MRIRVSIKATYFGGFYFLICLLAVRAAVAPVFTQWLLEFENSAEAAKGHGPTVSPLASLAKPSGPSYLAGLRPAASLGSPRALDDAVRTPKG